MKKKRVRERERGGKKRNEKYAPAHDSGAVIRFWSSPITRRSMSKIHRRLNNFPTLEKKPIAQHETALPRGESPLAKPHERGARSTRVKFLARSRISGFLSFGKRDPRARAKGIYHTRRRPISRSQKSVSGKREIARALGGATLCVCVCVYTRDTH